jgi:hypothetical protein
VAKNYRLDAVRAARAAMASDHQSSPRARGLREANLAVICISCGGMRLSGSDLVLVCEFAEDLLSADVVVGEVDLWWLSARLIWCELAAGMVRAGSVAVAQVLGQYPSRVVLADG